MSQTAPLEPRILEMSEILPTLLYLIDKEKPLEKIKTEKKKTSSMVWKTPKGGGDGEAFYFDIREGRIKSWVNTNLYSFGHWEGEHSIPADALHWHLPSCFPDWRVGGAGVGELANTDSSSLSKAWLCFVMLCPQHLTL